MESNQNGFLVFSQHGHLKRCQNEIQSYMTEQDYSILPSTKLCQAIALSLAELKNRPKMNSTRKTIEFHILYKVIFLTIENAHGL